MERLAKELNRLVKVTSLFIAGLIALVQVSVIGILNISVTLPIVAIIIGICVVIAILAYTSLSWFFSSPYH